MGDSKNKGRMKAGKAPPSRISPGERPPDQSIKFSFKYLSTELPEFCLEGEFGQDWWSTLLDRMKEICRLTHIEFVQRTDGGLRAHPVDWQTTAFPSGFSHLPEQVQEGCQPRQFALSRTLGRVFGFLTADGPTFHVVWIDRHHRVYPGQGR